ncbi:MAG: hypothetical protein R2939_17410, partial [Kofleriaceae bacterium]
MLARALGVVIVVAGVGGCRRDVGTAEPGCPALEVTVDGEPVAGLDHGLAFTARNGAFETLTVQQSNRADLGCEDLMPEAGRQRAAGERTVEAFVTGGRRGTGVALDDYRQLDVAVQALGAAAPTPGAMVSLCVPATTMVPIGGRHAGRTVT